VRWFQIEVAFRDLTPNQKPRRAIRNGNLQSSDQPYQSITCPLPEPNRSTRNADNMLPGKHKLTTVPRILLQLDIQPVDLPPNYSPPVWLGRTNFSNSNSSSSSNNNNSKRRVDTMLSNHNNPGTLMEVMANNPDTGSSSSSQSPALLISSANLMLLGRRVSASKPPTYSRLLLTQESWTNHLQKLSCLQTRL